MSFGRVGSTVRLLSGVEMTPSGGTIRSRAVTELMDVKSMLTRRKPSDISDYLDGVASFREGNCAHDLASGCRTQNRDRLCWFIRPDIRQAKEKQRNWEQKNGDGNFFHDPSYT